MQNNFMAGMWYVEMFIVITVVSPLRSLARQPHWQSVSQLVKTHQHLRKTEFAECAANTLANLVLTLRGTVVSQFLIHEAFETLVHIKQSLDLHKWCVVKKGGNDSNIGWKEPTFMLGTKPLLILKQ